MIEANGEEALPEHDLVSRTGPGTLATLEDEVLRHLDEIHAAAVALTRSRELARDLVSDAIRHAAGRWDVHRLGTNTRLWLLEILQLLFVARSPRRPARESSAPDQPPGHRQTRSYDTIAGDEMRQAVDALPVDSRAAVVFGDLRGLSYAELARVLGVPERTAVSRLHEGRRLLRARLGRSGRESAPT